MLTALVAGTTDPAVLAELARGRLRTKRPALRAALAGRFRGHQAFLVSQMLAHLDDLDEAIATVTTQIEEVLRPFAAVVERLDTIPGMSQRVAEVVVAEIGTDMTVFPTDRHLASGAALCPGHHESAGRQKSGRTRKGNRWLRAALVQAALGAIGTRDCALAARYRRLVRHTGHNKAVVAVAHALLVTIYHVVARETVYTEQGAAYFDARHAERVTQRAVHALERQGYRVVLERAA